MIEQPQIRQDRNWAKARGLFVRAVAVIASTHCLLLILHAAPQALTAQTWGPKFATAGTNLEFRRVGSPGKSPASNGLAVYTLGVSGFVPSATVDLWIWRVGKQPEVVMSNLRVNNGTVACDQSPPAVPGQGVMCTGDDRTVEISIAAGPGEPVAIGLVSHEATTRVFGRIVPFPFEVAQGSCRLSIERESQGGTLFLVKATGLRPNESLEAVLTSENEKANLTGTADSAGAWGTMVSPVVKGRISGAANVNLKSRSCKVRLDYRWGTSASPQ